MEKRVLYFDVLNVISCICVVLMHSNGYVHMFVKDDWWWLRVLIEVVCYFAVPVFFMLSGANLLGYRERYSTETFFQKRLLKAFIPFLIWGLLFYSFYWLAGGTFQWKEVLENFTNGKIPYTNYWFFIPLFILYLFIPVLSLIVTRISQRLMIFLICLLILFQSVLPVIYSMADVKLDITLPIGGFVVYALLGYYIAQTNVEKNSIMLYVIGIFAIAFLLVRFLLLYFADEEDSILFSYFGLYAILPAVFVFLLAKRHLLNNTDKFGSFWTNLSRRSYGIYLIHTFLIIRLSKFVSIEDPRFILISVVTVYSTSYCVVMLMQKFNFGKYLFP